MDQHTFDNWKKIKEIFEESGNTNNLYYKRAIQIIKTGVDPLEKIWEDQSKNRPSS
jgi:hypothetical protein